MTQKRWREDGTSALKPDSPFSSAPKSDSNIVKLPNRSTNSNDSSQNHGGKIIQFPTGEDSPSYDSPNNNDLSRNTSGRSSKIVQFPENTGNATVDRYPDYDRQDNTSSSGDEDYDSQDQDYAEKDYSDVQDSSGYDDHSDPSAESSQSSRYRKDDNPNEPAFSHRTYYENQQNDIQNNLANAEKKAANSNNTNAPNQNNKSGGTSSGKDTSSLDISKQEKARSDNSMNYKPSNNKGEAGGKSQQKGNFFSRHKKGILGGGLGMFLLGGIAGIGFIVSGPMQFLAFTSLLTDRVDFAAKLVIGNRVSRTISQSMLRNSDEVIQIANAKRDASRMQRISAKNMRKSNLRMQNAGVDILLDGMSIDQNAVRKLTGKSNPSISEVKRALRNLGADVPEGSIRQMADGKFSVSNQGMEFIRKPGVKARLADKVTNSHAVTRVKEVTNALAQRSAIKRLSTLSTRLRNLFAPIKRVFSKVRMERKALKISSFAARKAAMRFARSAFEEALAAVEPVTAAGVRKSQRVMMTEAADAVLRVKHERFLVNAIARVLKRQAVGRTMSGRAARGMSIGIIGLVVTIVELICIIEAIDNYLGISQMLNIVVPAIEEFTQVLGTSSMIMAGMANVNHPDNYDLLGDECVPGQEYEVRGDFIGDYFLADENGSEIETMICREITPMEQLGIEAERLFYRRVLVEEIAPPGIDEYDDHNVNYDPTPPRPREVLCESLTDEFKSYHEIECEAGSMVMISSESADVNLNTERTGVMISQNGWNAAVSQHLTGRIPTNQDLIESTPPVFGMVGRSDNLFETLGKFGSGMQVFLDIINFMVNDIPVIRHFNRFVCSILTSFVGSLTVNLIATAVDMFLNTVVTVGTFGAGVAVIAGIVGISIGVSMFANWLRGIAEGEGLMIDNNTTPAQHQTIAAYGALFSNNEKAIAHGGYRLEQEEVAQLWTEQRRILAEEWAARPWHARLFDASHYNSAVNVIARTAGFNTAERTWQAQIRNVGKFFGSLPQLFGIAVNHIGGTANAQDAIPFGGYEFSGVPIYGFRLNSPGLGEDVFVNAEIVEPLLSNANVRRQLQHCLGIRVTGNGDTLELERMDNTSGAAWNYIDNTCERDAIDPRVRVYVMDYFTQIAQDCWNDPNDADGSCRTIGLITAGGNNRTGSMPSGDNAALAQQILDSPNITLLNVAGIGAQGAMESFARGEGVASIDCPNNGVEFLHDDLLRAILMMSENYAMTINNFGLGDRVVGSGDCGGAHPRGLAVDFNGVTRLSDGVSRTTLYGDDEESRSLWRDFITDFADTLAQLGNSGASSPGGNDSVVMRISGNHCPASPLALQQFIQTFNGHTVASWGEYCSLFHVDIGFR